MGRQDILEKLQAHAAAQSKLWRNTVLGGRLARLLDHIRKFWGSFFVAALLLGSGIVGWLATHHGGSLFESRPTNDYMDNFFDNPIMSKDQ